MRDAFPDPVRAYAWEKIVLATVPFTGIVFYHFVIEYVRVERRRKVLVAFYAMGTVSAVFSMLGHSVSGMTETFYGFAPVLGWAFPLILIAAYPPVALALYDLTRARRTTLDREEAVRLQLLRTGVIISLLGATTDFVPLLGLSIYPMGVLGNPAFAGITSWAVMHHGLMNLRLALRRGAAYMVMSSAVFGVYGAIYGLLWLFVRDMSPTAAIIAAVGTILMAGLFVQPLVARVQEIVDRLFYRERFDRLHALGQLNEETRDIGDFPALTATLAETIRRTSQSDRVTVMLPDPSVATSCRRRTRDGWIAR